MKIDRILIQFPMVLLPWSVASAHTGHGDPRWSSSILHFFTEPEHAVPIAFAGVVGMLLGAVFAKRSPGFQPVEVRRSSKRVRSRR